MGKCNGKLINILWCFGLDAALFFALVLFLGEAAVMTLQDVGGIRSNKSIFLTEWHQ